MRRSINIKPYCLLFLLAFLLTALESKAQDTSNGMVFTGDLKGNAFTIATGDAYDIFLNVVDAYNQRDASAIWLHSADTVAYHPSSGGVVPMTKDHMAGFFSTVDSLKWEMNAVIPVQVVGSNRVNILVDSKQTLYKKDGTVREFKVFERFVFENRKIVAVHQWKAKVAEGNYM
jgi:hypothetical protein